MSQTQTVLRYEYGASINVTEDDFRALANAFPAEIEEKFPG